MLVWLAHAEFRALELKDQILLVHYLKGGTRVLQEEVEEAAVTVVGPTLHIVAFSLDGLAWHYRGETALSREGLPLGSPPEGGSRLIADKAGQVHLFYFTKSSSRPGAFLRHRVFAQEWSAPFLVTSNASADSSAFSVLGHHDHYLHLVYFSWSGQDLLYRVFNLEERSWSGAVSLTSGPGFFPQLIPGDRLHLFWLEEKEGTWVLLTRAKSEVWSQAQRISSASASVSALGYGYEQTWQVFWQEGNEFFQITLERTGPPRPLQKDTYLLEHRVVDFPGLGAFLLPLYRAGVLKEPAQAEESPPKKDSPPERVGEEAWRWEQFKAEIRRWQAGFTPAKPPDLAPFTQRLDRLESGFTLWKQKARSWENREERLQRLEQQLSGIKRRLTELEAAPKKRGGSIWRRVLGRD